MSDTFRHCYSKLPEAALLVKLDGTILDANAAAKALLRFSGPLTGLALRDLAFDPPEKLARFLKLCGRSNELLPGALTFKNGEEGGLGCRIEGAVFDPQEGLLLLRLFLKDEAARRFRALNERIDALNAEILNRRRAQAKLHAEQEWLRATLASIGDAVIATDRSGNVNFLNGVAQALTGWSQQEAAGRPLDDVFVITNEDTGLPVDNPVSKVLREGKIVGLANHTVLTAKDGRKSPIEDSAAPIRDLKGGIAGVVLVFRDITERKLSEAAVRNSEQHYRAIGESIPYGVWICAPDGRNIYASESFLQLVGITQQQCSDFGWGDVLHPDDAEGTIAAWKECVQTGGEWNREHRFRGVDGRYHWILARGVAVRGEDGEILSWAGINLDIDHLKAGEDNLRVSNQALLRANEDLNQFAFAASHDLQEPLRMITSYAQLLVKGYRGQIEGEAALCLNYITEGTQRMRDLLADLLAYTQVNADAPPNVNNAIDLNHVFEKAVDNCQWMIEETEAVVTRDSLPEVSGYEPHFFQLMQNLLNNALKYRSQAVPRVHVSTKWIDGLLCLTVTDNGIGIAPEFHQKIFGVFKRLHGREIAGTGIGLAICHRVVERYGGRIWVESEEGNGARFYCTLPFKMDSYA